MATLRFVDGPHVGLVFHSEGTVSGTIGLEVDEQGRPVETGRPGALAYYSVDARGEEYIAHLSGFGRPNGASFPVEVADGPAQGFIPAPCPAPYMSPELEVFLAADGSQYKGDGTLMAVAVYARREDSGGCKYFLNRIDDSADAVEKAMEVVNEQRLTQAINNFYSAPNYDIYSIKPTGEHEQVPAEVGHRRGHVDVKIAPIIKLVWRLGMDTHGSCQCRPPESPNAGQAYIDFSRERDAKRFADVLKGAGIECSFKAKEFPIGRKNTEGVLIEQIKLAAGAVHFGADDIPRVAEALRAVLET